MEPHSQSGPALKFVYELSIVNVNAIESLRQIVLAHIAFE